MKESDIRQVLRQMCDELDTRTAIEQARRTGKMVFIRSIVGASLGLSGCMVTLYAAPNGDVVVTDNATTDAMGGDAVALYSAPYDAAMDSVGEVGVLYAAPVDAADNAADASGVLYAAPVDAAADATGVLYAAPVDP